MSRWNVSFHFLFNQKKPAIIPIIKSSAPTKLEDLIDKSAIVFPVIFEDRNKKDKNKLINDEARTV